jgi:hypothetical protein
MESMTTNQDSAASPTEEKNPGESNPSPSPTPIAEFVAQPNFPECARNQFVDIGGYTGIVVDIVNNSMKVRSPEGATKGFNFHALKKLYAPRTELDPYHEPDEPKAFEAPTRRSPRTADVEVPAAEAPKRVIIEQPNFDAPIKPIQEFIDRADFPQCTFGVFVDIGGYQGVVVEIVNRSLKVRCPEERTKSFNADALRQLYHAG